MDVPPGVPVEPVFPQWSPSTSVLRLQEEISLFSGMDVSYTVGRHLSRQLFHRNEALCSIYRIRDEIEVTIWVVFLQ